MRSNQRVNDATKRRHRIALGIRPFFLVAALLSSEHAPATTALESTIRVQKEIAEAAAESQRAVDATFEATRELVEEYKLVVHELDTLRRYNDHVERMTERQGASIGPLERQLQEAHLDRRDLVPVMTRMVKTLERFIDLDMPFLVPERRERAQTLREMIDSPDIALSEKYRRVLEAYQIETDYGRTVEAYRGTHPLEHEERTVDFLRVGRIALLYRSLDGAEAGFWEKASESWKALSDGYLGSLEKGFRVARKQSAPELIQVPVPAPEALP